MLATAFRAVIPSKPSARSTHVNFYSTVADLARTRWRTGAHPTPKSLVPGERDDDDVDWPEPLTEGDASLKPEADEDGRPRSHRPHSLKSQQAPTPAEYRAHREAMKRDFPEGWAPPRKLSREAMDALRQLHQHDSRMFSTPVLAERFRISPEAVRRILRSKWTPSRDQRAQMAEKERLARTQYWKEKREQERQERDLQNRQEGIGRWKRDGFTLT